MIFFRHEVISMKIFVIYVHMINKTLSHKFHPLLFNFEYVNEVWISGVLGFKHFFREYSDWVLMTSSNKCKLIAGTKHFTSFNLIFHVMQEPCSRRKTDK